MADRPRLILASQSPRRAELLARLDLKFEIRPADIDEAHPPGEPPLDHAERLAREKARSVWEGQQDALVIGSDTIVVLDGEILGKPRDEREAIEMLLRLSGREHEVFTGVAIASNGGVISECERVRVRFRTLGALECQSYVATGEPMDKAGAYGIQGYGSSIVQSIVGDYFAVMGLPIVATLRLLERAGWAYAFERGLVPAEDETRDA